MQDLNTTTAEEDEAFKELEKQLGTPVPTQPTPSITDGTLAPNTPTGTSVPDINTIINNICTQLQLLATVISQHHANTTPPEGDHPLQETVELVLQQSEWFENMVKEAVEEEFSNVSFTDEIRQEVENDVSDYFNYRFDPSDHFDMSDLVSEAVSEHIGDEVESRIDDAIEAYMADAEFKLVKE